jgi:hypothetical protein
MESHMPSGTETRFLLDELGLKATIPHIRSSDYELALTNPFAYYLARRLSLSCPLPSSEALSRGSFFHACAEHDDFSYSYPKLQGYDAHIALEKDKLATHLSNFGIIGDTRDRYFTSLLRDAEIARSWYIASASVPLPSPFHTWRHWITHSPFELIAKEFDLTVDNPFSPHAPITVRFDLLLYHKLHNTLWIVDFKTTSLPPRFRALTITREFQTQAYLAALSKALSTSTFPLPLPSDVRVGGMTHIIVEKCPLLFSQADRSFTLEPFTPTRGPNKGVTRFEKKFHGDPVFSNYLTRVSNWYLGADEYADLLPERSSSPVVLISNTPYEDVLHADGLSEYESRLHYITSLATCPANPSLFHLNPSSMISSDGPTPFAPFAFTPPAAWPDLLAPNHLAIIPRN